MKVNNGNQDRLYPIKGETFRESSIREKEENFHEIAVLLACFWESDGRWVAFECVTLGEKGLHEPGMIEVPSEGGDAWLSWIRDVWSTVARLPVTAERWKDWRFTSALEGESDHRRSLLLVGVWLKHVGEDIRQAWTVSWKDKRKWAGGWLGKWRRHWVMVEGWSCKLPEIVVHVHKHSTFVRVFPFKKNTFLIY